LTERKAFTVNIPSEKQVVEADYLGIASGRSVDKLAKAKLTAVPSSLVDAPCIEECPVVLECKVIQTVKIGLHTQFIGEIVDVKAEEGVLGPGGLPDIEQIRPIVFSPHTHKYYAVGRYLADAFSSGKAIGE